MLVELFILAYLILFGIPLLIGIIIQYNREKETIKSVNNQFIHLSDLVVIIPFRNEEHRISGLLKSIIESKSHPFEYLFVNDHSTDNTSKLISFYLKDIPHRILDMPITIHGKKRAIRWGISQTNSYWILSLDADVSYSKNYIGQLESLQNADLFCLPVQMIAQSFIQQFFAIDVILANAFNMSVAGWKRPIMASGANLLYSRTSFLSYDRFEYHEQEASGDDVFLLRDFRYYGAKISLITDSKYAVQTETPQSLQELLNQRMRWISKTQLLGDPLNSCIALFQLTITFVFAFILIFAVLISYQEAMKLFILKSLLDLMLFFSFFKRSKQLKTWFIIPIYEVVLPIYSLLVVLLLKWYRPVWKGRTI